MFSNLNLTNQQPSEVQLVAMKKVPPANFEEWLIENEYSEWPLDLDKEDKVKVDIKEELKDVFTKEDIYNELKSKAAFQTDIFDDLNDKVTSLKETLLNYSSYFFNEKSEVVFKKKIQSPIGNRKYRASFDVAKEHGQLQIENSEIQSVLNTNLKSIEHAPFPGFFSHELTPLPGSLEAPQLLDQITKLQDFTSHFKKSWRNYFLSEASVAVLQDAFWWVFLKLTNNKNEKKIKASTQFFNRLCGSFVSLFLSVDFNAKDQFFKHYPDCLCQAIYSAFCTAFPSSSVIFDIEFREQLVALVYEWVTGSQPHIADIIDWWDMDTLESKYKQEQQDERGTQRIKSSLSFDEETFLDLSPGLRINDDGEVFHLFSPKQLGKLSKSHQVGQGAVVERVSFNIYGRSPLVLHYLASKDLLQQDEILQKIVTRTQVHEILNESAQTYDELIATHKKKSKQRKKKYSITMQQINEQCKRIEKQRKHDVQALAKVHNELLVKQSDVKILSEKIMDMIARSDFTTKQLSSNMKNGKANDSS